MTFENYKYTRPNLEETSKKLLDIEKRILDATSAKDVLTIFDEYNTLRRDLETQSVLVEVRHTINTTDSFYEEEQNFWDDYKPELTSLYSKVDKAIYNSKFKRYICYIFYNSLHRVFINRDRNNLKWAVLFLDIIRFWLCVSIRQKCM